MSKRFGLLLGSWAAIITEGTNKIVIIKTVVTTTDGMFTMLMTPESWHPLRKEAKVVYYLGDRGAVYRKSANHENNAIDHHAGYAQFLVSRHGSRD